MSKPFLSVKVIVVNKLVESIISVALLRLSSYYVSRQAIVLVQITLKIVCANLRR